MSCFRPLPAFRDRTGGQPRIGYHAGENGDKLFLPCGHCIGCKRDNALAWATRCMHEAQLYDCNLFLTLTYKTVGNPSLEYRDFQLFMKKLRKEFRGVSKAPTGLFPIRFFCAGEYGETYGRPHWHALLFNMDFPDKVRFENGTFRSAMVESLWEHGMVVVGSVTPQSAAYVAGYTQNKVYGRVGEDFYEDVVNLQTGELSRRRAPFCAMSRRPGLGTWWYEKYGSDLFPHDFAVVDGKKRKVPRFYWNKFREEADGAVVERIENDRYERSKVVDVHENSEGRREVREAVAWARVKTFGTRSVG